MKHLIIFLGLIGLSGLVPEIYGRDSLYNEEWRPQYHFTPAHRWIGDPCGLVYFNGKFHSYSWGGAESFDLLHWTEINDNAIKGTPDNIAQFTGSVVVDKNNTAGYGENAFIAAFTSYDKDTKKQSQSIAFSRDEGRTFQYYDLNPVIDIWSTEFRDPTVIRDEKNGRWIMLVAKALEKKIAFYGSTDLKHWEWLSEFGPAGDSDRSWECPDMFVLPVEGQPDVFKWVLLVSINWAKEQYFVGDFDGTRFIPDDPEQAPLYVDAGLDYYASRTFQDFDGNLPAVYSVGWVSTWDYAQHVPTKYGKGVWSLPRELSLTDTPEGFRLIQRPLKAIADLRGNKYEFNGKLNVGITDFPKIEAMDNCYEAIVKFSTDIPNTFGINLCQSSQQKIMLTYDTASKTLSLDRTNISEAVMPKFERIAFCKVEPADGELQLDIFVDKSVVEVYVNGGLTVMTALAFPGEQSCGFQIFALKKGTRIDLTAYSVDSVWD